MQYNPDEYAEILNIFKAESEEIIQSLNDGFLELEKNPEEKKPIKKLFQLAHSIKGAARMLGFNSIQDISHKLEDILSFWKQDNVKIDFESMELMYKTCDFLTTLVDKAVSEQSDVASDDVINFLNKLDTFLQKNSENNASKSVEYKEQNIYSRITDINAILLELMFILEKDEDNNDNSEEIIMVASDNLSRLHEIFMSKGYSDIIREIEEISKKLSSSANNAAFINDCRNDIIRLRDEIYKKLNVSYYSIKPEEHKETVSEKHIEESGYANADFESEFDSILTKLPAIKKDRANISKIITNLELILKNNVSKNTESIIIKIINILNLFDSKNIVIDNDYYRVILQGLYLAKKISIGEKNEDADNIKLLMQRLKVVEDLLSIDSKKMHNDTLESISNSSVQHNDFDMLKKNLNAFELQEIKTLRVDTTKIDNLISQTGELLVNGIKTREHLVELAEINSKLIQWNSASKKIINYLKYIEKKGFFDFPSDDSFTMFYKKAQNFFLNNADMISEIQNDFGRLYNIISEDDNKLHQTAMGIETIAKDIRILPLATIFHSFPRMMRDLANENNKKIDFIISGSDTTVDKKLIEEIKMPLIHILRNAVSHGIEVPQERKNNGKQETGTIRLSAKQADNNVIIEIEDDGYGINLEKVKKIAVEKGLLFREEIENMTNEQLTKLLFLPGFSTNDSINEISGRGVGLDIVKTKINYLNGDIYIDSVLNKGCKVTIKLPLIMSTLKTFLVLVNGQKYALPVNSIKFVKIIKKDEIFMRNGQNCILYDGHSIPVYSLSEVLGEETNIYNSDNYTVIIIENQDEQAAYITDKLLGDQEIFHKKLIPPIIKIRNISGFTTLATGEICLIINPYELIRNTALDENLPSFDLSKIKLKNLEDIKKSKKVVIFDQGGIDNLKNDLSDMFENTVIFSNIYPLYDFIQKNDIDIFVCKIDYDSKEILKLLQYIKNDEMMNKIKIVIASDLTSFDILNILGHFKPDLYIRISDYDKSNLTEYFEKKL